METKEQKAFVWAFHPKTAATDKIRLLAYKMFEKSVYARDLEEFRKSVPDDFVTSSEVHLHIDAYAPEENCGAIVDDLHELYEIAAGRNDLEKRDKWIEYMQKAAALRRNMRGKNLTTMTAERYHD